MHQKKEFLESATLADMMSVCDGLAVQGYIVHIEYLQAEKKIMVYGEFTKDVCEKLHLIYIKKLKEQYAILAAHPPAPERWDDYRDYQALMQGLERQLIEAGVQL